MAKVVFSVRLEPELVGRLDQVAEEEGVPRGDLVERLLLRGLASEEKFLGDVDSAVVGRLMGLFAKPAVARVIAGYVAPLLGGELDRDRADVVLRKRGR